MEELAGANYDLIYADPPWRYAFSRSASRRIERQYPTMSMNELIELPVDAIVAADALAVLWTTAPKLRDGIVLLEEWGFTYKTSLVWDKEALGMGFYSRVQHEILLVGTRGKIAAPEPSARRRSVIRAPRGRHSEKPTVVYDMLESWRPTAKRIELFARQQRPGWDAWGNEVPSSAVA
jgi:N6-adenosine-specific RNA methylase IME4